MDADGRRAAQLLDIFRVEPLSAGSIVNQDRKININTAPREVLRALVSGVNLEYDLFKHHLEAPFRTEHRRFLRRLCHRPPPAKPAAIHFRPEQHSQATTRKPKLR